MKKLVALILCLFLAAALFAVAHADPSEHQVTLGIYENDNVTVVDGVTTVPVHAWLNLYAHVTGADRVEILVDGEELETYEEDEDYYEAWWDAYDAPSTYTVTVTAKAWFGQETATATMPITVTVGPELQGSLTYTVSGSTTVPLDGALTVIVNNLSYKIAVLGQFGRQIGISRIDVFQINHVGLLFGTGKQDRCHSQHGNK